MFGYVTINKPEIRFKDYDMYRAYYCGLCRDLAVRYGFFGRMTLGYDMAFLILLLTGLYDTEESEEIRRCAAHPLRKHRERRSEFTEYAADMNLLLFYHKCFDDWKDERKLSRRIYAAVISRRVKYIEENYRKKAEVVRECLSDLSEAEKNAYCVLKWDAPHAKRHETRDKTLEWTEIDETAGLFGQILAEIFAYRDDVWADTLRRIGFYLGKFIYLMDAYEDIEEDIEQGRFNPLSGLYGTADFDERCASILKMMIAECADSFERLPVVDHMEILRNILYAGVWTRFDTILQKRKEKENV